MVTRPMLLSRAARVTVGLLAVGCLLGLRALKTIGGERERRDGSAPTLQVTPDGGYEPDRAKNSTGWVAQFTVDNRTGSAITVDITSGAGGGITITNTSPTSLTLGVGDWAPVNVTYNVGTSGGQITVGAEGGGFDDAGFRLISTPPTLSLVTPALTLGKADTAVVYSRTPLIIATYSADTPIDTNSLVLKLGNDTVTTLARRNRGLLEWEVDSAHQLQPGVPKTLVVRVCHINSGCTTATRQLLLDNSGSAIVSFTGMPLDLHGNAAEVETGFAIPAYFSMGVARSAGLVYSTRQSYPRVLVNTDIELTWPVGNPDQIKAILKDGIVGLDSLTVNSPSCNTASSGRRCRITLQGDFSGSTFTRATRKWLKVEVRVTSGATTKFSTDSVEVVLVDRRSSPYGSGWFVGGLQRLDSAGSDMIMVGPTGAASLHRGNGGVYLSPPGVNQVLLWTGTQWELQSPRAGCGSTAKLVFDTQGRQTKVIDCHSNTTTIKYGATLDRVDTIIDPVGKKISFTYNGTPKLTTITDAGGRQSIVTVNGSNQLVYDSLASPSTNSMIGTFTYTTYGGSNTVLLASQVDALGQVTIFGYDAGRRRPNQTTLPAGLPETGTTAVTPVITYRAQVLRGLDTLLSADSIFGQQADPLGRWSRTAANRWGGATRVWDALGTVLRATYLADGRALWTEGKVADSTRVYQAYDALNRPLRSYRLRAAGDTVLIDSLVYDASHRVTKRFNALRQAVTFTYNTAGDVLTSVTPTADTTSYLWLTNGQLNKVKAPGQAGWTIYAYDATWKNVQQVTNSGGVVLNTSSFDSYGRVTESKRKLTVRTTYDPVGDSTLPVMRWQRTLTAYLMSNLVDSSRTEYTAECNAPCNAAPPWPTALGDSLRWQRVRHLYDRLGRDTARVNTRDKRTRYAYDPLGRVVKRWPFADSTAVVDSFRFDIAGNLRYHWTRRGTLIEHRYDSRNRDTLMLVPGIGNYRRIYNGPGDQLTRIAITGYVDSIGGVVPDITWTYSQAGLLLTDTAQGTRVTVHRYDKFGRDTSVTDVLGTWRQRYDAVRGMLDTVVTPFNDSLTWAPDNRWRPVGPTIRNGSSPDFSLTQSWDQVGKLTGLTSSHVVSVGQWSTPEPAESGISDLNLLPTWNEQHGSGGASATYSDSLAHDGWGRVAKAVYMKNGTRVTSDSLEFDRDGNLRYAGVAFSFDATTTRLLSHPTNGGSKTYSYDRSGNLVSAVDPIYSYTYSYDALDRLVAVREHSTLVARYGYDVVGRRIVKRVYFPGGTTNYVRMIYRGNAVIAETDSIATTLTLGYTWGLGTDNLVAVHKYSDGTDYYVVQDELHTVRGLTKRDGTWVASWRYSIYGWTEPTVLDSAGAAPFKLRYRWTGREYDLESHLYYFRGRYYDPQIARFIQEDPVGFVGGTNLYVYGDGNPTNGRDPDGLAKNWEANVRVAVSNDFTGDICWSSHCGGGSGGDGWDPWGQEDDYDARWEQEHPHGEVHTVTICSYGGTCNSVTVIVANSDFNPSLGHEVDLIVAASWAAIGSGVSSFMVSSFTSGHAGFASAHNLGNAMDISMISGVGVQASSQLGGFLNGILGNTTVGGGSVVMAPGNFGYQKTLTGGSWGPVDMSRIDTRQGSPYYGQTMGYMHRNHIHFQWGPGAGVPEY